MEEKKEVNFAYETGLIVAGFVAACACACVLAVTIKFIMWLF